MNKDEIKYKKDILYIISITLISITLILSIITLLIQPVNLQTKVYISGDISNINILESENTNPVHIGNAGINAKVEANIQLPAYMILNIMNNMNNINNR